MYFNTLGTTKYENILITDILKRIILSNPNLEKSSLVEQYIIIEGETPESVSFNYYGDVKYYWIIMLLNNIKSRYFNWPLSSQELQQYIESKYGNRSAIFFQDNELQNEIVLCKTKYIKLNSHKFKVLGCDRNLNKLEIQKVSDQQLDNNDIVDLLDDGELVFASLPISRIVYENEVALHHINSNQQTRNLLTSYINETNLAEHVSNTEFEIQENENKRNIILLNKNFIGEFVTSFKLLAEG